MTVALLLDEMHAPLVASTLRDSGHDVLCVADQPELRGMPDPDVYRWATEAGRCIVTENVKDFRPLLLRHEEAGRRGASLLFTSSRTFPRSRRNPGPLIDALDPWLQAAKAAPPPSEDWLQVVRRSGG